jgi:hypothetical protein
MGDQIEAAVFTREDRQRYREKVHRCLDVLAHMLQADLFDFEQPMTGMEIELNLVDADGDPSMSSAEVLALIDDPAFQTELGRFNLEINVQPRTLAGHALEGLEQPTYATSSTARRPRPRRRAAAC